MKAFYYLFCLKSNRGTNQTIIRRYEKKPDKKTLDFDLEDWEHDILCIFRSITEYSIGWEKLTNLPKNRRDALKKWDAICKQYRKVEEKRNILMKLLSVKPFNGEK